MTSQDAKVAATKFLTQLTLESELHKSRDLFYLVINPQYLEQNLEAVHFQLKYFKDE